MGVIDLGDLSAPAPPEPRSWPVGRQWRWLGLSLVVAVCIATLHSVPSGEPTVRTLWTAPHPRTVLVQADQDTVYAHRAVGGGGELTAYDLATGHVRWTRPTTPATLSVGWISVLAAAKLLLVPTENGDMAVDATTGARLWSLPGYVESHTADTVLLRERDERGRTTRLRLVDSRDGATIWQRPMGDAGALQIQFHDGRPAVIAVDTGDLTLLRYDNGDTILSRHLPRQGVDEPDLAFVGDQILVQRRYSNRVTLTGHRLDTLAESWQAETAGAAQDCGPVVCVATAKGISGLDPGTGAEKWLLPGSHVIWSVLGDRLVTSKEIQTPEGGPQPLVSVIDASTGRRLRSEVVGQPTFSVAGDRRLLVLRPRSAPVGPTSVYDLDLDTGRSILIGEVDFELLQSPYELAGRYLIRLRGGQLEVMAVG